MSEGPSLRRQWILLKALSSRRLGLTVREMVAELGVTDKTIRRDLARFRRVGFPLEESAGEFGRKTWRIAPTGAQPPLAFTYDEAIALHMGRRLLEPLAGTPFGEAAEQASRKVRAALGQGALDYLTRFSALFHETGVGRRDYSSKSDLIDALRTAAEDGRPARLLYRAESDTTAGHREVHPFGVVYHRGALYLVAMDAARGLVKHYKVDRVEDVELLDGRFARPEGFDLAGHMATAFGIYRDGEPVEVKVRFGPTAARYVRESRWHESQRLAPLPDGGVLAAFTVSGTEEIKRWILGFGAKAVVLAPECLRREVVEEIRTMLGTYSDLSDGSPMPTSGEELDDHAN